MIKQRFIYLITLFFLIFPINVFGIIESRKLNLKEYTDLFNKHEIFYHEEFKLSDEMLVRLLLYEAVPTSSLSEKGRLKLAINLKHSKRLSIRTRIMDFTFPDGVMLPKPCSKHFLTSLFIHILGEELANFETLKHTSTTSETPESPPLTAKFFTLEFSSIIVDFLKAKLIEMRKRHTLFRVDGIYLNDLRLSDEEILFLRKIMPSVETFYTDLSPKSREIEGLTAPDSESIAPDVEFESLSSMFSEMFSEMLQEEMGSGIIPSNQELRNERVQSWKRNWLRMTALKREVIATKEESEVVEGVEVEEKMTEPGDDVERTFFSPELRRLKERRPVECPYSKALDDPSGFRLIKKEDSVRNLMQLRLMEPMFTLK